MMNLDLTEPKSEVCVEESLNLLLACCILVTKLNVLYIFFYFILKSFEKDIKPRYRKYILGGLNNLVKVTRLVSSIVGV